MWIAIIPAFVLAVSVIVFLKRRNSINLKYICTDGEFRIKGKKQNLKIYKGNRFVFNIVNGRVVSFVDKSISNAPVAYEEIDHGNS